MPNWHEQMVTVAVQPEGLVLEGIWQAGQDRAAVIAPPHPLYGGHFENPVLNELAYALYKEGFASLRFNWRGAGGSQGVASGDPVIAERDYRAAVDHMAETLAAPITGAGYSFGAATALLVALSDERLRDLVLVAPPIAMIRELDLEGLERPIHVIVGSEDQFAPAEQLSELLAPLPHARLNVIPKVDHFFSSSGLGDLNQLVRAAVS